MWDNTGNTTEQDEQRHPFYPVDTGNPMTAALSTLVVVLLLVLGAWVAQ